MEFAENRIAFDDFYKNILPIIKLKHKKFQIAVTGNKSKINKKIKQMGVLNYSNYLNLLKQSKTCVYSFRKGPGTKIKVIEALCNNIPVLTNKYGFQGIDLKNKNKLIFKNKSELLKKLDLILSNQDNFVYNSIFKEAQKKFNFKIISNEFFKDL